MNFKAVYLKIIYLLLFIYNCKEVKSQTDTIDGFIILENLPPSKPSYNSFFIELGGNGGIYSLNYDRILVYKSAKGFSIRAGINGYPRGEANWSGVILIEGNFFIGRNNHHIETGIGYTHYRNYLKLTTEKWNVSTENYFIPRIGYRYQNTLDKTLFFKAGLTPDITFDKKEKEWLFFLWAGIGIGVSF